MIKSCVDCVYFKENTRKGVCYECDKEVKTNYCGHKHLSPVIGLRKNFKAR